MKSLFNDLSEITDIRIAIRRLKEKKFRDDICLAVDDSQRTVRAIKEHQDKDQILHGLVYMLPLTLPLLRLLPADELSAANVKEGFRVVRDAMEDTLADYSELLHLPDTEQQDALKAQVNSANEKLQQLQDEHLQQKKELLAEQTELEKKKKQISSLKKQIFSLEEKLQLEKQSLKEAKAEEQQLKSRMKKTGTELEGQEKRIKSQAARLQNIRLELEKVEKTIKYKALIGKMDTVLKEARSLKPEDELSKLAAVREN